jgi:hypothetical protein
LTSALDWGEWSASHIRPRITIGACWIRDWVGLRAGVDTEARACPFPVPGTEPWSSSLQSDTSGNYIVVGHQTVTGHSTISELLRVQ